MADTFQNEVPKARIFRKEFENILKDPTLSSELRDELAKIAPQENV